MPTINIKCANVASKGVEVTTVEVLDLKITVAEFKALISPKFSIPAEQQRLIYAGHVLKDPQTLESCGTIHYLLACNYSFFF